MSQSSAEADRAPAASRQAWMAVLAKADCAVLEAYWRGLAEPPEYALLRPAETGLVMVRGRISGTGAPFNLGEMTMTRCAIRLTCGTVGFGHVAGRDRRHAELAAVFDALLQTGRWHDRVQRDLIDRLAADRAAERDAAERRIAATKVEFFTLVRGE